MTDNGIPPAGDSNEMHNQGGLGQEKRRDFSIYCSNMPEDSKEDEIREMFSKYGDVHAVVIYRPHDQFRGIVFVRMDSPENCQKAINALNETQYRNHIMKLSVARDRSRDGRRDGNGNMSNSRRRDGYNQRDYNKNNQSYPPPPPPPYNPYYPYPPPMPPYFQSYAMPPQPIQPMQGIAPQPNGQIPLPGQPPIGAPQQPGAQPMYDPRLYNPYAVQQNQQQPPAQPAAPARPYY